MRADESDAHCRDRVAALDGTSVAAATVIAGDGGGSSDEQGESEEEEADVGDDARHVELALNS